MVATKPVVQEAPQEEEETPPLLPPYEIVTLPLSSILLPPDTPSFLTDARKLVSSITNIGLLQIPIVAPAGFDLLGEPVYQVVDGRRRCRALRLLNWVQVRAICCNEPLSQQHLLIAAREANFRRSDDFGMTVWQLHELLYSVGLSESELVEQLGVSKGTLDKYLKLAMLPTVLVEQIRNGKCSQAVAGKVARLPRVQQRELAEQVETLLATLEGKDLQKFKVTEEMVTPLRTQMTSASLLAGKLATPLIPAEMLEEEEEIDPEDTPGPEPATWEALYRDLYREVYGDVPEAQWIADAERRRARLELEEGV